ncbi:hypothetical protein, partial [Pseudopedobacter sp.]|uniref:hypothetical protein n=1 Tax=Pseudopedobacter sp. TaxID=1936787 RepID=UPI00333E82AB
MKKLILTAIVLASTMILYAQSSWQLENEIVNYNLTGTASNPLTRTGASLNLISNTITPAYLPCPTDGIVHVLTSSSAGNKFVLDQTNNGFLTFNTS